MKSNCGLLAEESSFERASKSPPPVFGSPLPALRAPRCSPLSSSALTHMLRLLLLLLAVLSASAKPAVRPSLEAGRAPLLSEAVGDKAQLTLDPLDYRSSSQGPIMPAELEAASKEQYDEIDAVIDRATRTAGWLPIIPQYKRGMQW
eukprot:179411-Prymnesium_polylepis.1